MNNTPAFPGFFEPKSNYYRLPNNWFDVLTLIRQNEGPRIASIVKVLEYLIRHTWSLQPQSGLTETEIRKGKNMVVVDWIPVHSWIPAAFTGQSNY